MTDEAQIAKEALAQFKVWWSKVSANKAEGAKLTPSEEKQRASWVAKVREAISNALDVGEPSELRQLLWLSLQIERFDAITTSNTQAAVGSAHAARNNAKQLLKLETTNQYLPELQLTIDRADVIIAAGGVKPAGGWTKSLQCNAPSFWEPCKTTNNYQWALVLVGVAALAWYGRKKKWF